MADPKERKTDLKESKSRENSIEKGYSPSRNDLNPADPPKGGSGVPKDSGKDK